MAVGVDRAILLETDGREWDPVATAAAIVEAIRAQEAADGAVRPAPVRQRGGRHGRLPGRHPGGASRSTCRASPGSRRSRSATATRRRAARGADGGWEIYEVPLPAVVDGQGGDQPAALPVGPGPAAGEARRRSSGSRRRGAPAGPAKVRLRLPEEQGSAGRDPRHAARTPRPRVVEVLRRIGACLVSGDPRPRRARRRRARPAVARGAGAGASLAGRRSRGGPVEAVLFGPRRATAAAGPRRRTGSRRRTSSSDDRLDDVRARGLGGGARRARWPRGPPTVVIAAGSDRGNEVLAHVAARTGLPAGRELRRRPRPATRGGSPASAGPAACSRTPRSTDAVRLLTVAPARRRGRRVGRRPARRPSTRFTPALSDERTSSCASRGREAPTPGAISLTDARVVVGGGRGVGQRRGLRRRSRSWPACWAAPSACSRVGDQRRLAAARGADRPDRPADRARPLHRLRHQRRDPAHRRLQGGQADPGHQHATRSRRSWAAPTTR